MPFVRSWFLLAASVPACGGQPVPEIVRAEDLYRLTRAEMLQPVPVRIRGIVTYNRGGEFNDFTMQDETGGFIADAPGPAIALMTGLVPGQEVEIEGVTMIDPPPTPRVKVTRLVPGGPAGLPKPQPFTPEALLGGAGRLCFVEFSGVIREAHRDGQLEPPRLVLTFGSAESRLAVWLARFDDATAARLKPDTRVRVHGVSMAWTSANLQPYSTFVVVHDPSQIDVLSAPRDPASLPVEPIEKILSSPQESFEARRIRVRGTVTLEWPGETVVIQDGTAAIRTSPAAGQTARLGERVDATGFFSADQGRVLLDEAIFTGQGAGGMPEPERVSASGLIREAAVTDRDASLVRLEGVLLRMDREGGRGILRLESDGVSFDANLPPGQSPPAGLESGSRLELTGVSRSIFTDHARRFGRRIDRFEVDLPQISGIRVLSRPPWWTVRRLAIVTGIILASFVVSVAWVVSLRRRIAARTALLIREIRARHDNRLLDEERGRLAADLHDTLSQTLSGAALQLEIADSIDGSEDAAAHRELARRLVDRGREDLRRAVWDLTPSALLSQDLRSALSAVTREMAAESGCEISLVTRGEIPPLPGRTRSHLLRVGQEAIHNAIRHGRPKAVSVSLVHEPPHVSLTVGDDGAGFDPALAPGAVEGHFGLGSMRNRIERLGGSFTLRSSPRGTIVRAVVPDSPAASA